MATRKEINDEFYAGYGDQPRGMTLMDYLSPSSYVDPYKAARQINTSQVMPQTNVVDSAPATNRGSMPSFNLGNLTNYIPSASTIGEYIPTSLPNVFGVNNPLYAGLLGADQSQALSKQSNIAGLLGAAAALVQGMGRQGGRRSAAGNIISALGAGYGSAGQAYQQGLQSYGQAQQLALQQRQQAGVQAMKMKYPDLADEFDTNPAGAFRIVSEREAARVKPTVVSEGGALVSPTGDVLYTSQKGPKTVVINGQLVNAVTGEKIGEAIPSKESDPTTYKEWERLAKGGYKGTYEQYLTDPRFDKSPKTTVNVMPPGAVPLGKEGANKVDTALLDLGQNRLNLQSIAYNFKPEYLKDTFKLRMAASAKAESLGLPVDDKTKTEIANYSKFTQDAYNGLNAYINLITGAAVGSGEEEARIRKGVPDPQKDSPTEFWTKLNSKMREGRLYEARLGYIKQNGMKMTDVSVEKIPTLMRQTEAKLKADNKLFGNKPYNDKDPNHKSIVRALMSKEFGLME
jgi:hypothetical protein